MAKNERKNTACPGGTCGAEALMQIAMPVKTTTERTLRPMPRSGFMGRLVGRPQARAGRGSPATMSGLPAGHKGRWPSARAQSSVASSAGTMGANISSISASVMIIGGQRETESLIARPMTPRAASSATIRGPTLFGTAKPFAPSGASSMAPISPRERTSPTSGCPAIRSRCAAKRGASSRTRPGASIRS